MIGPILYVMTFKTLEEAVEMHNDVRQGLSSALFICLSSREPVKTDIYFTALNFEPCTWFTK
ncbi:MAG: aldehyde dehydrogenase family protein, partial [Desulfosalsimonadaceae bacterium]